MSEPFYVYLAAPLTDLPAQYLANVATMSRMSRDLMRAGYIPINPAADMLEGLMSDEALTIDLYQSRSMALLELLRGCRRAALFVIRLQHADGRPSTGVRDEIANAQAWGIPVVTTRPELARLREATE